MNIKQQIAGWWKCTTNDSKRCIGTYVYFNANGQGNYCIPSPNFNVIDPQKRFTVTNTSGYDSFTIRWDNELGESGSANHRISGNSLQKRGKAWLERVQVNNQYGGGFKGMVLAQMSGWWKCVGADSSRCVGKYVYFTPQGAGNYAIPSTNFNAIDPQKRYTIQADRKLPNDRFEIKWQNENNSTGIVVAKIMGNTVMNAEGQRWLMKAGGPTQPMGMAPNNPGMMRNNPGMMGPNNPYPGRGYNPGMPNNPGMMGPNNPGMGYNPNSPMMANNPQMGYNQPQQGPGGMLQAGLQGMMQNAFGNQPNSPMGYNPNQNMNPNQPQGPPRYNEYGM